MIETWGNNRRSLRGKKTKDQIISEIKTKLKHRVYDLQYMNSSDLNIILNTDTNIALKTPEGRRKKPYIDELLKAFPEVKSFDKVSLLGLKSLIEALND